MELCGQDMIVQERDAFLNGTSPNPRKADHVGSNFGAPSFHLFSKSI